MAGGPTPRGLALRLAAAFVLVFATWNPSGHSYLHWALDELSDFTPLQAILGLVLAGGWLLYVRAALHALGGAGAALIAALLGAFVWLLASQGWLDVRSASALAWIALIGVSLILGIGLSWSHLRRRITGQVDVEGGPKP